MSNGPPHSPRHHGFQKGLGRAQAQGLVLLRQARQAAALESAPLLIDLKEKMLPSGNF